MPPGSRTGKLLPDMGLLKSSGEREAQAQLDEERRVRDENATRRFEYHVLRVGLKARAEGQLNDLGSKGWQLVQVVETDGHLAFYLERELPAQTGSSPAAEPTAQ